jgi:hypothetical protein
MASSLRLGKAGGTEIGIHFDRGLELRPAIV